jgi:hypothetical protein
MCKTAPGPRCSNHVGIQRANAWEALTAAKKNYPADSLEVKAAERAYYDATEAYKSTPSGLEELAEKSSPDLEKYTKIRAFQTEALAEIKNGRMNKINELATARQSFYDDQEMLSVSEATRKAEETKMLEQEVTVPTREEKRNQYFSMLNQYENDLADKGQLTSHNKQLLGELRSMTPPKEMVTLQAYQNVNRNAGLSREALRKELSRIATIQDVSLKVVEAYHDGYRKDYSANYEHLPVKLQPNPPEKWVTGEFQGTGFQNDKTTSLVPSDKASMYATYRLRADANAIPDYLKNSRILASTKVDAEAGNVSVVLYNNKGREIDRQQYPLSSHPHEVADKLRGKIIVMDSDNASRAWLSDLNKKTSLNSSVLNLTDLSSKHLNTPDNSLETICQSTGVDYGNKSNQSPDTVLKAYFGARQKIEAKWKSKSPRKKAAPLESVPLTSRWT